MASKIDLEALGYLHTIRDMAVNLRNDIVCFCLVKNVNLIKKTASISTGSWLSKQPGQVFDTFFKLLTEAR